MLTSLMGPAFEAFWRWREAKKRCSPQLSCGRSSRDNANESACSDWRQLLLKVMAAYGNPKSITADPSAYEGRNRGKAWIHQSIHCRSPNSFCEHYCEARWFRTRIVKVLTFVTDTSMQPYRHPILLTFTTSVVSLSRIICLFIWGTIETKGECLQILPAIYTMGKLRLWIASMCRLASTVVRRGTRNTAE